MKDDVILGLIVGPHGLGGAVKVKSYADSPESFTGTRRVFLLSDDGTRRDISVEQARPQGNSVLLKFSGVDTREQAEDLVGWSVVAKRDDLPAVEDGEFYWHDVIGMEVYDASGKYYGIVTSIIPTGANDVFIVKGQTGDEILIPGTFDAVREINVPDNRMIIEPFSGPVFHETH
jgi:16S rRNA processing protein RimM